MNVIHTLAIVINVMDYGESDKIIAFYTRHHGKIKAIAKGAKRSKKRFVNKLEFFTNLTLTAVPGRHSSLARVDQAELVNPYPTLRENFHRYTAAMLVCELVDQWTRENDCDEHLFFLLNWVLDEIAVSKSLADIIIFFQIKLLDIVGVGLQLDQCLSCNTTICNRSYRFSQAYNGLLCSDCWTQNEATGRLDLSAATIKTLLKARSLPLAKLHRLKLSKISLRQATKLLRYYQQFQLQRDINSWKQFSKTVDK
jgi:DNA repair protein RecO (recombination protein O)